MAGNQRLNATITIGGVVSATLGKAVEAANSRLGSIGRSMGSIQNNIGTAIRRNDAALDKARGGIADAVGSFYALKGAIAAPVQAAMDFESAMADVTKVVDFPTPGSLMEFKQGLRDLSKEVPITVTGLAEIAAAAGQAGIAGDDLIIFTEAAAKIGTAFDISAGEAGESMAKLKTGLGMTIPETVKLFDAMNHLSNVQASSAPDVLDVVRRVGAMGKQFGFTAEETAAFGSAMLASGAQSEVAATSFLNMGRALTRGASATKRQSAAMAKLGLDSEDVAKRMQQNAVGTTIDIMERMSALPKHVQASVASDLFGDEARALGPLLTNLDLVRESVGMVEDETSYAGSAFKEFQVRNAVFSSELMVFKNRIIDFGIAIGEALIPRLRELMNLFAPVIDQVTALAAEHPKLVGNVMLAAGAFVALKGAVAALKFAGLLGKGGALSAISFGLKAISLGVAPVIGGLGKLRAGMMAFSTVAALGGPATAFGMIGKAALGLLNPLKLVGFAFNAIRAVFMLNPIGVGVASIIGGAVLIYKHWGGVKEWFGRLWGNVTGYFTGFGNFVVGVFTGDLGRAWGGIKTMWGEAIGFFKTIWDGIGSTFTATWNDIINPVLSNLADLFGVTEAWEGLKTSLGAVIKWIGEQFDWVLGKITPVIDALKWVSEKGPEAAASAVNSVTGGHKGPISRGAYTGGATGPIVPPPIPARAVGGPFGVGPVLVGERGPEVRFEERAGFIATNRQLGHMAGMAARIAALGGALAGAPAAALPIDDLLPSAARMGSGASGSSNEQTIDIGGITIIAQQGQDPRQIADEVLRVLQARARGALFDGGF